MAKRCVGKYWNLKHIQREKLISGNLSDQIWALENMSIKFTHVLVLSHEALLRHWNPERLQERLRIDRNTLNDLGMGHHPGQWMNIPTTLVTGHGITIQGTHYPQPCAPRSVDMTISTMLLLRISFTHRNAHTLLKQCRICRMHPLCSPTSDRVQHLSRYRHVCKYVYMPGHPKIICFQSNGIAQII